MSLRAEIGLLTERGRSTRRASRVQLPHTRPVKTAAFDNHNCLPSAGLIPALGLAKALAGERVGADRQGRRACGPEGVLAGRGHGRWRRESGHRAGLVMRRFPTSIPRPETGQSALFDTGGSAHFHHHRPGGSGHGKRRQGFIATRNRRAGSRRHESTSRRQQRLAGACGDGEQPQPSCRNDRYPAIQCDDRCHPPDLISVRPESRSRRARTVHERWPCISRKGGPWEKRRVRTVRLLAPTKPQAT
ncbi:hypothetical protein M2275_004656 [Rhodococcus opacus]|nr:hypothetical protein [Rhodococcus opacus]